MKKLIMISVIFALVAGAAFAEATLGGQLMIGTTLLTGTDKENSNIVMGGLQYHEAKMSATFGDAKGGGKLVFTVGNDGAYSGGLGNAWKTAWGFLYWRPVPAFKMEVGVDADGKYGAAQISGWGFTGEAKNSVGAISDYMNWGGSNTWWPLWVFQSALTRKGNAFYPGTGDLANVTFQFFPIDPLTLTFVLPIGSGLAETDAGNGNAQSVGKQLADFHFNLKYSFEDLGLLNISFVGKGGLGTEINAAGDEVKNDKTNSVGNLYASFYLTAISGMGVELGLVYGLPWENAAGNANDGYLGVGVGFRYDDGGQFTFKLRANARLLGQDNGNDMPTQVYANILPCYKINSNLWFFFYAGIGVEMNPDADPTSRLGWFVNPYIWVRASEGLRFWTGLQIFQDGRKKGEWGVGEDAPLTWRVPFGFNFYF